MSPASKWPQLAVTGTVRVYVAPCQPLDLDQGDGLHQVLERFLDALRLQMFPGTLSRVHGITRGEDGKADARFDVVELDVGA